MQVFGIVEGFGLFTKIALGNKVIKLDLKGYNNSIYLRKDTTDIQVFDQIFVSKGYDSNVPFKVKRIIDCGSNIGLSAIFLQKKYPESHIVLVEPNNENFYMCQKNIAGNLSFTCIKKGIWNKKCFLKITNPDDDSWAFKIEETNNAQDATIEATTIDEIMTDMQWDELDILKIDIEGAEKAVFEKHANLWLPKVKSIFIELHDDIQPGTSKLFFEMMEKYRFTCEKQRENWICIRNEN